MTKRIWTHGLFQNTFNADTNTWTLTRISDESIISSGPKAAPLGKIGQTLTKLEKTQSKRAKLEAELAKLIQAEDDARGAFSDAVEAFEADKAPEPEVELTELSRVELLDLAREKQIVGRDKMKKIELLEALQAL